MKKNKIYALILIILLTLIPILVNRIDAEKNNKSAAFVVDYTYIKTLSDHSDASVGEWLDLFKELGFDSVSLYEESINSMTRTYPEFNISLLSEFDNPHNWAEGLPQKLVDDIHNEEINEYATIISTSNDEALAFLLKGLESRFKTTDYTVYDQNDLKHVVLHSQRKDMVFTEKDLSAISDDKYYGQKITPFGSLYTAYGIGYDPKKIAAIKEADLKINFRPLNNHSAPDKSLAAYIADTKTYDSAPDFMMFTNKEVLGYGGDLQPLENFLITSNIPLSLFETNEQRGHLTYKGMDELTYNRAVPKVRSFIVWNWIAKQYDPAALNPSSKVEDIIYRAISERNINVIFFRPFLKNDNLPYVEMDSYRQFMANMTTRLDAHNISIGSASELKHKQVSPLLHLLLMLELLLLGIEFVYPRSFKKTYKLILTGLGALALFALFKVNANITLKLAALLTSILFPTIAINRMILSSKNIYDQADATAPKAHFKAAVLNCLWSLLICMTGGLVIASLLSNIEYLLEIDIFRGVKFALVIPLIACVILYLKHMYEIHTFKDMINISFKILTEKILVWQVLAGVVFAGVILIYLARTGHETAIKPLEIELILRNKLEYFFLARPRTKEFLVGYPTMMIMLYFASLKQKELTLVTVVFATIGLTSTVNTFCHLRTPVYMSIYRSIAGMGIGLVIGIVGLLIIILLTKPYLRIKALVESKVNLTDMENKKEHS